MVDYFPLRAFYSSPPTLRAHSTGWGHASQLFVSLTFLVLDGASLVPSLLYLFTSSNLRRAVFCFRQILSQLSDAHFMLGLPVYSPSLHLRAVGQLMVLIRLSALMLLVFIFARVVQLDKIPLQLPAVRN